MKKIMIFTCLMVFLVTGILADDLFDGLNFKLSVGAESFSAPVTIKEFNIFHQEFSWNEYKDIFTLSLYDINGIETQNRIFTKLQMESEVSDIYVKIGALQMTEKMSGGFKVRRQNENFYPYTNTSSISEYMGQEITSRPYDAIFWAAGSNIYLYKNDKIAFVVTGEYSTFYIKKFYLDFLYNYEKAQQQKEDIYINKTAAGFNCLSNKMLKIGMQITRHEKNLSQWINIGYVFYQTILDGKYSTEYFYSIYDKDVNTQRFFTTSKLIDTLLISGGFAIKITEKSEIEASASLGALNGAGLSWKFLL